MKFIIKLNKMTIMKNKLMKAIKIKTKDEKK